MEVGQWYRASRYAESHLLSADREHAVCGRPLTLADHEWVVAETRKNGHCSRCKGVSYFDEPDPAVLSPFTARLPVSREGRQAALALEAKVALLQRAFGAKEVR